MYNMLLVQTCKERKSTGVKTYEGSCKISRKGNKAGPS